MMYQNKTYLINKKIPKKISYLIFISIFMFILLFFLSFVPFKNIVTYDGFITIIENEYYIKIYVSDNNLKKINCENVIVDEKERKLEYFKVKEAYTINNSLDIYHEVLLKVKLEKKLKIENYKVEVLFIQEKITVFNLLKDYLKKGLYERINKK